MARVPVIQGGGGSVSWQEDASEVAQRPGVSFATSTNTINTNIDDNGVADRVEITIEVKADSDGSVSTGSGNGIKLENDAQTPGASKYYGTDSGGTKGWYDLPA